MLLIRKYIVKEILLYFVAIIFFLFLIFITNKFIGLLTKAASGQLPFAMVCQAMLLYVPEILGLLMPLSLFIAVLFVVSKLYADQEIVVLFTSGLNWYFLINTVIRVAVFVAILTAAITLWLAPYATKIREEVLSKGKTLGIISSVVPGRFQVINDGKQVFYVGNVDNKNQNNKIQDIFIATNADNQLETLVVTAKSGSIETLKDQDGNFLVLQDGHRYSGIAGNANFSVIDFAEYGRQLLPKDDESPLSMHKVQKTNEI